MNHRCGGELQSAKVKIKKKVGYYFQSFTVDGYKCDYCGEEVISRDTALAIDKAVEHLRDMWSDWRVPSETRVTTYTKQQSLEANTYIYG